MKFNWTKLPLLGAGLTAAATLLASTAVGQTTSGLPPVAANVPQEDAYPLRGLPPQESAQEVDEGPTRYLETEFLKERGIATFLMRWEPGAVLTDHEHVDIEQTYVLEGSFEDDHGACKAGEFIWRPAGSRHEARSPGGALMLAIFMRPNKFFDQVSH